MQKIKPESFAAFSFASDICADRKKCLNIIEPSVTEAYNLNLISAAVKQTSGSRSRILQQIYLSANSRGLKADNADNIENQKRS
ncbi:MAG: hypothetical protein P8J42_05760 [Pseudomonadales bacterium]|nr:hypothetical protein [Pseudomonadales bacterium]